MHTWRLARRKPLLKRIFAPATLEYVWKKYLRTGLRNQIVTDLHDYNDVNNNRQIIFEDLTSDILQGSYAPLSPFFVTSEKKEGVCRHIIIPSARDALFLQAIVEYVLPEFTKRAPSSNAFFSRSHSANLPSFKVERDPIYPWFFAWQKFSRKRHRLLSHHKFIAVTDISNYYDSIRLDQLRNIMASVYRSGAGGVSEIVLDLITENLNLLTWVPDYLPRRHEGLVQLDFDAPRLFAHVYAFEVDALLRQKTNDRFLRWIDDITFPGESKSSLRQILGEVDDLLHSRGCRLNLAKTHVFSAKEADLFFRTDDNIYLETMSARALSRRDCRTLQTWLQTQARKKQGQWDKLLKRGIPVLTKNRYPLSEAFANALVADLPSVRKAVFANFLACGYSTERFDILIRFLNSGDVRCGESVFGAWRVITGWPHVPKSRLARFRSSCRRTLGRPGSSEDPITAICGIRYHLLYSSNSSLISHLIRMIILFHRDDFVMRQVSAALAHFPRTSPGYNSVFDLLMSRAAASALPIIRNLDLIEAEALNNSSLRGYVLPSSMLAPYGLERFLIARSCARSPAMSAAQRAAIARRILSAGVHERIQTMWHAEF